MRKVNVWIGYEFMSFTVKLKQRADLLVIAIVTLFGPLRVDSRAAPTHVA